jgi:two-component system response regulator AtoC
VRRVLVVDDEENIRLVLSTLLRRNGYQVEVAPTAEQALEMLDGFGPDFVLADVKMPGMSGIALCTELKARGSQATVVVMSAYGSIELALEAIRAGAYDYLAKPFKQDEVLFALRKVEERESLRRENRALREAALKQQSFGELIGKSSAMAEVFRTIEKVAEYRTTVLIQGESGTGKELVARALHRLSPRASKPLVAVNCGAIPESLMESELFGHKRGAFTDAHADKTGIFQEADQGTLFLDEIGELPLSLQVKLLRVLQEGTIRRLGDTKDVAVDVRMIAATIRDLAQEVEQGRFREDLFYRLNVIQIEIPPLRERPEDVVALAERLLAFHGRNNHRLFTGFTKEALQGLTTYLWPGNVRELSNVIERAAILCRTDRVGVDCLPANLAPEGYAPNIGDPVSLEKIEEQHIRRVLAGTKSLQEAADILGMDKATLWRRRKKYGI